MDQRYELADKSRKMTIAFAKGCYPHPGHEILEFQKKCKAAISIHTADVRGLGSLHQTRYGASKRNPWELQQD